MIDQALTATIYLVFVITAIGILCAFYRLVKGPTLADRVVAMDMISIQAVAIIALDAIRTDQAHFLRVAISVALIAFLGTVAFAFYLRRVDLSE